MKRTIKLIRKLHKWPGILFLIPAVIISITSLLLAFDGPLNMERVKIKTPFFSQQNRLPDVKTMLHTGNAQYIGTRNGLYIVREGKTHIQPELHGYDIRALLMVNDTLLIASRQGVWYMSQNRLQKISEADAAGISLTPEGHLLISQGRKGFEVVGFDGKPRSSLPGIDLKSEVFILQHSQTLKKFIIDLHTGEAIVGKTLMPWWIGLAGLGLLLLAFTGAWILVRRKMKKWRRGLNETKN